MKNTSTAWCDASQIYGYDERSRQRVKRDPRDAAKLHLETVGMRPGPKRLEPGKSNGHRVEVSPLKRVLMRTMPELEGELKSVINAFDPWARDRGEYYSIDWKPRRDAKNDPAFLKE